MHRLVLFFSFFVATLHAKPLSINISAKNAILINAETGAVLFEKNGEELCFPASITKIATALYVIEKKGNSLQETAVATQDDLKKVLAADRQSLHSNHPIYRLETSSSLMHIRVGERLSIETLLYGLLLCSANDAANVLARHISGNVPQFMNEVNQFLVDHGITHTRLYTPHGLHYHQQVTTASDMAKIAQLGLKNPLFRKIVKTVEFQKPESNMQKPSVLRQTNRLLKSGQFYYSKAIGIKTGHTAASGFTLVAAAEDKERTLIAVILNAASSENRFKDAITLFDKAFAEKKIHRVLLNKEFDFFHLQIPEGESTLEAALGDNLEIDYFPSEEVVLKTWVDWDHITLPVSRNQEVGRLHLVNALDVDVKIVPIYATHELRQKPFYYFFEKVKELYQTQYVKALLHIVYFIGFMIVMAFLMRVKKRRAS